MQVDYKYGELLADGLPLSPMFGKAYSQGNKWYALIKTANVSTRFYVLKYKDICLVTNAKRFLGAASNREEGEWNHIYLPYGGPKFLLASNFSCSSCLDPYKLFPRIAQKCSEIGAGDTWIDIGYATFKILKEDEAIWYEWMKKKPIHNGKNFPPYMWAGLMVRALECESYLDRWYTENKSITPLQLLTDLKVNFGKNIGKWFCPAAPRVCVYDARVVFTAKKKEISVKIDAPGFRGGSIVIRITELEGTVTDHILKVEGGDASPFECTLPLSEELKGGKGGRSRSAEENKNKAWALAEGADTYRGLLSSFSTRQFWKTPVVRHVQIDPNGTSLLIPSNFACYPEFHLEILDQSRWHPTNKISLGMQIMAATELFKLAVGFPEEPEEPLKKMRQISSLSATKDSNRTSHILANLKHLLGDKKFTLPLREATLTLFCQYADAYVLEGALEEYKLVAEGRCEPRMTEIGLSYSQNLPLEWGRIRFILNCAYLSDVEEDFVYLKPLVVKQMKACMYAMKTDSGWEPDAETRKMRDGGLYSDAAKWLKAELALSTIN